MAIWSRVSWLPDMKCTVQIVLSSNLLLMRILVSSTIAHHWIKSFVSDVSCTLIRYAEQKGKGKRRDQFSSSGVCSMNTYISVLDVCQRPVVRRIRHRCRRQ
ncbi:uncharacterized protein LOC144554757 [Carex rostrata]